MSIFSEVIMTTYEKLHMQTSGSLGEFFNKFFFFRKYKVNYIEIFHDIYLLILRYKCNVVGIEAFKNHKTA